MNKWFKVSGTVAMIAAAGVLTVNTLAFAQDSGATPENEDTAGFVQRGERGDRAGRGDSDGIKPERGERAALFAEALGISVEELEAAKAEGTSKQALIEELGLDKETVQANMQVAMIAQLQTKVADGSITQEQADAMVERIESGEKSLGHKRGGRHGGKHGGRHGASPEVLADALGISVEELEAAKAEGKSPQSLIEELGLDQETVQAKLQAAHIAQIQAKVTDGTITQEQADTMIERIESGEKGFGHRGGKRGGGERDGNRGGNGEGNSLQQNLRGLNPFSNSDA